nr:Chain C, Epstein Barr Virus, Latent Membrane Protein 2 epitope [synthetic construct]
SSCSSC